MTEEEIRAIVRDEFEQNTRCSCQYGPDRTPLWYESVRTCPRHWRLYQSNDTPYWFTQQLVGQE